MANCATTKRLLLEPIRPSAKNAAPATVLDTVASMIMKGQISDECFYACSELVKIMALHGESRVILLKVRSREIFLSISLH